MDTFLIGNTLGFIEALALVSAAYYFFHRTVTKTAPAAKATSPAATAPAPTTTTPTPAA